MSILKVNTIQDLSGNPNKGKVIQVVQSTKTDTASVTGSTFGDVGLSASITPSATNHKILIMIQANIGASVGYDMKARLFTSYGASPPGQPLHIGDAGGTRPRASVSITQTYAATNNAYNADQAIITYLDGGHNQTTSITYSLQLASYSTYTVYLNRSGADLESSGSYDARTASSITLMEISD